MQGRNWRWGSNVLCAPLALLPEHPSSPAPSSQKPLSRPSFLSPNPPQTFANLLPPISSTMHPRKLPRLHGLLLPSPDPQRRRAHDYILQGASFSKSFPKHKRWFLGFALADECCIWGLVYDMWATMEGELRWTAYVGSGES